MNRMHLAAAILVGGLAYGSGQAFAQHGGRTPMGAMVAQAQSQPVRPAVDPNSSLARSRAALSQGFAPINTDSLSRGFNR